MKYAIAVLKGDGIGPEIVAEEAGNALVIAIGQGKPSKAILEYAHTHHIDLIVMGSRGLSAVAGVLGSVSYAVLRNAECPVMIER